MVIIMNDDLTESEQKLIEAIIIVNRILMNQIVDKAIEKMITRGDFVEDRY